MLQGARGAPEAGQEGSRQSAGAGGEAALYRHLEGTLVHSHLQHDMYREIIRSIVQLSIVSCIAHTVQYSHLQSCTVQRGPLEIGRIQFAHLERHRVRYNNGHHSTEQYRPLQSPVTAVHIQYSTVICSTVHQCNGTCSTYKYNKVTCYKKRRVQHYNNLQHDTTT